MSFSSPAFLFGFLPVFLLIYYLPCFKSTKWRSIILIIFSVGFYAWAEPVCSAFLVALTFLHWLIAKVLTQQNKPACLKKIILIATLVLDVALLSLFKYSQFFVNNIRVLLGLQVVELGIVMPLGMSFIIFSMISYLVDAYRNTVENDYSLLNTFTFLLAFPKLIMGPLARLKQFKLQVGKHNFNWENIETGVSRFCIGLAKKVLLADSIATVADASFSAAGTELMSVLLAVLGAIAYTLQIYFDFSGYTDMAIGICKMIGIDLPENFDYPYISRSVSEFWRRWHITLGSWFKEYVYFPLGGSRVSSKIKHVRNLFVVWLLTGLWHGASWTFVLWGLMYFAVITVEKLTEIEKYSGKFGYVYTMFFTITGWVIFRSESFSQLGNYLSAIFGINTVLYNNYALRLLMQNWYWFALGILFCSPAPKRLFSRFTERLPASVGTAIRVVTCLLLFMVTAAFAVSSNFSPFIYNNF